MNKHLLQLMALIFPTYCSVCGERLNYGEAVICSSCWFKMPYTSIKGKAGNPLERIFWGKIPIERVNSFLTYLPKSQTTFPLLALKYHDKPQYGIHLGKAMAYDLMSTDFFSSIDYLIPVPLSRKRLSHRGYNQSEKLAQGVHLVTGIPILLNLIQRSTDNPSQTTVTKEERAQNVTDIFTVIHPESIAAKHILLIDDVLTTGATLLSCAKTISRDVSVRISILTLYVAGHHYPGITLDNHETTSTHITTNHP